MKSKKQRDIKTLYLRPKSPFYSYYNNYLKKDPSNCETDNVILSLFRFKNTLPLLLGCNNRIIGKNNNEEEGIYCSICMETYCKNETLIGECGHTLCASCFFGIYNKAKNGVINCHLCRNENKANKYLNFGTGKKNKVDHQIKHITNKNNYCEIFRTFGIKFIEIIKYFLKNKKKFYGENNIIMCDSELIKECIESCEFLNMFNFKIFVILTKVVINKHKSIVNYDNKNNKNNIENMYLCNDKVVNVFMMSNKFDHNNLILGNNLENINFYRFIIKNTIEEKIFGEDVILI